MRFIKNIGKGYSPEKGEDIPLFDIVNAICVDIYDIFKVDIVSRTVTAFRQKGLALGINETLEKQYGYEAAVNAYIDNNVYENDRESMRHQLRLENISAQLKEKESVSFYYRVFRDNELHYFRVKCIRLGAPDSFRTVVYAFMPEDYDVSQTQMLHAIETDELTGIYTRQAFMHHAKRLMDENPSTAFDLTITDVENFKLVNSIYGLTEGDRVLKYLANCFSKCDCSEICARYGADQFVILSYARTDDELEKFENFAETVRNNAPVPYLALRYGMYRVVDRGDSVADMCEKAMLALKSSKHRGHDGAITLYEGQVVEEQFSAQMFEAGFERAITNREFVVWCQPKFNTFTEKMSAAEALVRWKRPDGEMIPPGKFIPVFESCGLAPQLDEYVFRIVCQIQRELLDKGIKPLPISVNISRTTLFRAGAVKRYKDIAEQAGIEKSLVPLELTESATIDQERIQELVKELRDSGFTLHMDDFGSGYSSLSSISVLPFDVIKLDKSLVDAIGNNRGDEILRHIIELSHFCNMEVVAEGVEQNAQLAFLKKLRCDTIQGYIFSKPVPAEEYIKLLTDCGSITDTTEDEKIILAEEASVGSLRITNEVKLQYLSAIASIYMTMHVIDLKEDTVVEFATTTNVKEHANRAHNAAPQMEAAMRATVSPECIEDVLEFTDLTTIAARMKGKRTISAEFNGIHFGWFRARFIAVTTNDRDEPEVVIYTTQVLEPDRRQEEMLIHACRTDELTGVFNLHAFEEDIKSLSDPKNRQLEDNADLTVMMVDINDLKSVNHARGHAVGDELIWGTAETITGVLGKESRIYRIGGDEFAALFYAGEEELEGIRRRYIEATENWMGNENRRLSTAFGIVARREFPKLSPEMLVAQAELRMYEDKKNRFQKG